MKLKEYINVYESAITKPGEAPKKSDIGKDEDDNSSGGLWSIDAPKDDSEYYPLDPKTMSKNIKRLKDKFNTEDPFFIQGEAGWGKTSLIIDMAGRYKRHVITVYLHHCEATDLGGIPAPVEDRRTGHVSQQLLLPAWAEYMRKNKDKKFLLFFDEMNQAAPDVMNALMPIVLETKISGIKFNNFMVGAAGNFDYENEGGINELSGPLKSRFKPLIKWECDWNESFRYLHNKWDNVLGKQFVDLFEEAAPELFTCPREIELKIFKYCKGMKDSGDYEYNTSEDYYDHLVGLLKMEEDELTKSQRKMLENLAENIYKYINNLAKEEEKAESKKRGRGQDMLPAELKKFITSAVLNGYMQVKGDPTKYGFSKENINTIIDIWNESEDENGQLNDPINAEMLNRHIRAILAKDNAKWKYETDAEWKKAGLADPNED